MAGKLEGPESEKRKDNLPNPKNSIQGKILTDGADRATQEEDLPVFWPLFPFDIMPLKEGEHAYVIFEDNGRKTHGLWVTRAPDNKKVEQLNLVPGEKKYKENSNNDTSDVVLDQDAQDSDIAVKQVKQSDEFVKEDVPDFTARIGDRVLNGSNNTLVLLTRDRIDEPSSGEKEGSGTIFLVAGRKDKEKLNLIDDKSYVMISMKSDIDTNLKIDVGEKISPPPACIAIKSDEIRILSKKTTKLIAKERRFIFKWQECIYC